jgi:hypothetical protein
VADFELLHAVRAVAATATAAPAVRTARARVERAEARTMLGKAGLPELEVR